MMCVKCMSYTHLSHWAMTRVPCTGFQRKYIKYTVTTRTDLKTFGYSPVQVVRRFSDFVALEYLLRVLPSRWPAGPLVVAMPLEAPVAMVPHLSHETVGYSVTVTGDLALICP